MRTRKQSDSARDLKRRQRHPDDPLSALGPFDRRCMLALLDPAPRESLAALASRLMLRWSAPGAGDLTGRGSGKAPPAYRLARLLGRPDLARAIRSVAPLVNAEAPLLREALSALLRVELVHLASTSTVQMRLAAVRDLLATMPLVGPSGRRSASTTREDRMRAALGRGGEDPDAVVVEAARREEAAQVEAARTALRERASARRRAAAMKRDHKPGAGEIAATAAASENGGAARAPGIR